MKFNRSTIIVASALVLMVVVNLPRAESRAVVLENDLESKVKSRDQFWDYEYTEMEQGPRTRRFALPIDIANSLCPPGQKSHSSGNGCVLDDEGFDGYGN